MHLIVVARYGEDEPRGRIPQYSAAVAGLFRKRTTPGAAAASTVPLRVTRTLWTAAAPGHQLSCAKTLLSLRSP